VNTEGRQQLPPSVPTRMLYWASGTAGRRRCRLAPVRIGANVKVAARLESQLDQAMTTNLNQTDQCRHCHFGAKAEIQRVQIWHTLGNGVYPGIGYVPTVSQMQMAQLGYMSSHRDLSVQEGTCEKDYLHLNGGGRVQTTHHKIVRQQMAFADNERPKMRHSNQGLRGIVA
jgi:hypothetical protein